MLLRLPEARKLESVELLEQFLREREFARIFAADLRERIVDLTPDLEPADGFRAHVEINVWLAYHAGIDDYVVLEGGHCCFQLPALESAVFAQPAGVLAKEDLERVAQALRRRIL